MPRWYEQIHEGMEVCDPSGDKIGMAGERIGDYFNVDAGFLGTKEYYVPFDAVTNVTDDTVFISARKDEFDNRGWDKRPDEYTGRTDTERDTMQLREEELRAQKTSVETGQVHLGKEVVEEARTVEVPVTREEVTIERHPVERRPADRPIDASESETIRVPVREEQVQVEKTPVVYEEVGVGKRTTQETRQVSDTVRREELRTDTDGDIDLRTDPNA